MNEPRDTEQFRITKSPFEIVLLDDMAGMLFELVKIQKAQLPRGFIDPRTETVTSNLFQTFAVSREMETWFAFSITNDGPDVIEFVINSLAYQSNTLKVNETLRFDFKQATVSCVFLRAVNGIVSTVRLYGVY